MCIFCSSDHVQRTACRVIQQLPTAYPFECSPPVIAWEPLRDVRPFRHPYTTQWHRQRGGKALGLGASPRHARECQVLGLTQCLAKGPSFRTTANKPTCTQGM